MKKKFTGIIITAFILLGISSCDDDLRGYSGGGRGSYGNYSYGDCYIQIVDNSYSGVKYYYDNNPCVPPSVYTSYFYGPCNSSTYYFDATLYSGNYWNNTAYSMYRPYYGYNRYYTLTLTETRSYLNYYDVRQ